MSFALASGTGCHRNGVGNDNNNNNVDSGLCEEGYVIVPAGPFEMGVDADDPRWEPYNIPFASTPKIVVQMSDYCIQRTELSVGSYRACVEAGVCEVPANVTDVSSSCNYSLAAGDREDHPVTCLTWEQARTFCQDWEGGDLPSEAQWEKAARGDSMDGRILPWGDAPVSCERANYDENGDYNPDTGAGWGFGCFHEESPPTWRVGYLTSNKGDSPYGLKDMAGNVSEFTLDCYDSTFYERCAEQGCVDPVDGEFEGCRHSARGSGAPALAQNVDVVGRGGVEGFSEWRGFRCVRNAQNHE
ncbi:MAG: SUMF1/EgtB/PvdO family nonheme iron enzyme [Polyangia bacterium]|jgi:formylglycine-generating enzyme required for sulfatase activity|nr:SUMF1/EgtB/PvdO family nonheme iron enzyme [Polyangia bacterium]